MSQRANRTLIIAERDGWICNGCGEVCVPYEMDLPSSALYATIDHRDPDGGNGLGNLWLMCSPCNSSKGRRSMEEWEKTLDFDGSFLRKGFTQIPNTLLFDATVSVGARMSLICLMQFAWKGDPFPGQEKLGSMLGVTDRTVRDYLTELKAAGYLKVFRRGRGKTNVYRIVQNRLITAKVTEESSAPQNHDRNGTSGLDRNPGSGKEYEVEEDEAKPVAATPRPADIKRLSDAMGKSNDAMKKIKPPRARNDVWDALAYVFGEPTVPTAIRLRGQVCRDLTNAGATKDQVVARASAWPAHFDNATITDTALRKHWDTLGRKPLRRAK